MQTAVTDRLWDVFEPYLAAERIELDDLVLVGSGKGTTLKVVVDSPGGIDLDRISDLSYHLSRLLDQTDDLTGPYNLEVTSPGLERKLHRPIHFHKACGREVVVKLTEGQGTIRGELAAATERGVTINSETGETIAVDFSDISEARTIFRWGSGGKKK